MLRTQQDEAEPSVPPAPAACRLRTTVPACLAPQASPLPMAVTLWPWPQAPAPAAGCSREVRGQKLFSCSLDIALVVLTPCIAVVLFLLAVAAGVLVVLSRKRKQGKRGPRAACCCFISFGSQFPIPSLTHPIPDLHRATSLLCEQGKLWGGLSFL